MTPAEVFIALAHRLRDYADTVLLMYLLQVSADATPYRTTVLSLADSELNGLLSRRQVRRSVSRLVNQGLLSVRIYPHRWTEFKVSTAEIHAFLERSLEGQASLPGVKNFTCSFLSDQPDLSISKE